MADGEEGWVPSRGRPGVADAFFITLELPPLGNQPTLFLRCSHMIPAWPCGVRHRPATGIGSRWA